MTQNPILEKTHKDSSIESTNKWAKKKSTKSSDTPSSRKGKKQNFKKQNQDFCYWDEMTMAETNLA